MRASGKKSDAFSFLSNIPINGKSLKDHMEAIGHKEAFGFVRDLVLTDKKEDRDVYCRVPVRSMGAKYEPVQPYRMLFIDGNGRTGRLLVNLELFIAVRKRLMKNLRKLRGFLKMTMKKIKNRQMNL